MSGNDTVFSSDQIRLAKLEGALRLAVNVLRDGEAAERSEVADRVAKILGEAP